MLFEHPSQIRQRLRRALCHLGRATGTVYRPDRDQFGGSLTTRSTIGRVAGYFYAKAQNAGVIAIALPGQLDDMDRMGENLMVLYASRANSQLTDAYDPPVVEPGDILQMDGGKTYTITRATMVSGAYYAYSLKET